MNIIATNIAQPVTFEWNGRTEKTGIYKKSVDNPILLQETGVDGDSVIDKRYHGDEHKAGYLYSVDHYPYWKKRYPDLDWEYGMFGENITIEGLNETQIKVGEIYKLGEAVVQITQPRQPCFKLGHKFQDQGILKEFINTTYSGTYIKVLEKGYVEKGDAMKLIEPVENGLTIAEVFSMLYQKQDDYSKVNAALKNQFLPEDCLKSIRKKHGIAL